MSPLAQWIVIAWLACAVVVVLWMIAQVERSGRRRGIAPRVPNDWQPALPGRVDWSFTLDHERPIEEVRLMPGAEQRDPGDEDWVPEGLGVVRPPKVHRATPSHVTPFRLLRSDEQALWRDAMEARP